MMKTRLIYHMVIVIAISVQAYTAITDGEFYPFSRFPMYKGRISEINFYQCSTMVKLKDIKKPIRYRKVGSTYIEYFFQHGICDDLNDARELLISKERFSSIADEYLNGITRVQKDRVEKISFIASKWHKFTVDKIDTPDEVITVYEKFY